MAKQPAPNASRTRGGRNSGGGGKSQPPATTIAAAEKPAPKRRVSPAQFFREVRAEARKITWPSRKETWITSVMVFLMVAITTVFFFVVDFALGWVISQVIKIGA